MRRLTSGAAAAVIILLMASAVHSDMPGNPAFRDNLIEPGIRIGPVYRDCTRDELGFIYGEQKLEDMEINAGEGNFVPGTVIKGGSDLEIRVVWTDDRMDEASEILAVGSRLATEDALTNREIRLA